MITVKGGGGMLNNPPVINEFKVINVGPKNITISYKVEDIDLQIVRHFLTVHSENGVVINKKDITKELGYEKPNNLFSYNIPGLTRNTNYTIQIECTDGLVSSFVSLGQRTENTVVYELIVNENNSNSFTSVTYGGDAVGIEPAVGTDLKGWANKFPFNKIRLVGLKNGAVTKEIQKNNKKLYVDGTRVDADPDVDVMTEFPKIYWKFVTQPNGYKIIISDKSIEGGACFAHRRGNIERDVAYLGCYLGSVDSQKRLRSQSGKSIVTSLDNYRSFLNSETGHSLKGYEIEYFYLRQLESILKMLAYKNRNAQLDLGWAKARAWKTTGTLDTAGFIVGSPNSVGRVSFLGIEDVYGNIPTYLRGSMADYNYLYICSDNKDLKGAWQNWQKVQNYFPDNQQTGFFKNVMRDNLCAFSPKKGSVAYISGDSINYGASTFIAKTSEIKYCVTAPGARTDVGRLGMLDITWSPFGIGPTVRLAYLEA